MAEGQSTDPEFFQAAVEKDIHTTINEDPALRSLQQRDQQQARDIAEMRHATKMQDKDKRREFEIQNFQDKRLEYFEERVNQLQRQGMSKDEAEFRATSERMHAPRAVQIASSDVEEARAKREVQRELERRAVAGEKTTVAPPAPGEAFSWKSYRDRLGVPIQSEERPLTNDEIQRIIDEDAVEKASVSFEAPVATDGDRRNIESIDDLFNEELLQGNTTELSENVETDFVSRIDGVVDELLEGQRIHRQQNPRDPKPPVANLMKQFPDRYVGKYDANTEEATVYIRSAANASEDDRMKAEITKGNREPVLRMIEFQTPDKDRKRTQRFILTPKGWYQMVVGNGPQDVQYMHVHENGVAKLETNLREHVGAKSESVAA